jgi:hypothetical protein
MIDWVVHEIVVKKLANSKSFQRFAVKTDTIIKTHQEKINVKSEEIIRQVSKKGEEIVTKTAKKSEEIVSATSKEAEGGNLFGTVGRFAKILKEEVQKDFGKK